MRGEGLSEKAANEIFLRRLRLGSPGEYATSRAGGQEDSGPAHRQTYRGIPDGLAHKWDAPKFTQVFLRKLQMLATKYDNLRGIDPAAGGGSSSGSVRSVTSGAVDGANGALTSLLD